MLSSFGTAAARWLAAFALVAVAGRASAELLAAAEFRPSSAPPWAYTIDHPDGVAIAAQASGPRLEDERWVLRLGASSSTTRFAPVPLDTVRDAVASWVMRVERARWEDDAYFEVRARDGAGEERMLARWDADDLRAAKPGRGNFQSAALPAGFDTVEIVVEARAAAARGAAWIDFFWLRLDGSNREPAAPVAPEFERPPYLQLVGRDRATLRWRSRYPTDAVVRWWPSAGPKDAALTWRSPTRATEHAATLPGLEADTLYRYEVDLDGVTLADGEGHRFRTAPGPESEAAIDLWVIGDSGMCGSHDEGCEQAGRVRDAFVARAGPDAPQLWLLLGDNAYPHGTDWQYTRGLFQHYREVAARAPMWSVAGNHDFFSASSAEQSGVYFESFSLPAHGELGGVPSGTEAYYSFDWGPLHIVALDSQDTDRGAASPMARWLEEDLAAATDARWRIALLHHAPYSRGSHDSDDPEDGGGRMIEMREVFNPILERHGVDLVLAGHSHGYERSVPLHGHYGVSTTFLSTTHRVGEGAGTPESPYRKYGGAGVPGTLYAVVGSASEASNRMKLHPVMARSLPVPGSLWLRVSGDTLRGRFIGEDGEILDDFAMRKDPRIPLTVSPGPVPIWLAAAMLVGVFALAALWWGRPRR